MTAARVANTPIHAWAASAHPQLDLSEPTDKLHAACKYRRAGHHLRGLAGLSPTTLPWFVQGVPTVYAHCPPNGPMPAGCLAAQNCTDLWAGFSQGARCLGAPCRPKTLACSACGVSVVGQGLVA